MLRRSEWRSLHRWWQAGVVSDDLGSDWQAGLARAARSSASPAQRRKLAERFAAELRDLPTARWARQASGAELSQLAAISDDPALADIVAEAWELARSQPPAEQVWSRSGDAGVVVVAHGPAWSLVARSGGPVLVLSEAFEDIVRLEPDPDWLPEVELSVLVGELIAAARGEPPLDESQSPPMPPLPWHGR
jgi:hypothetical protein